MSVFGSVFLHAQVYTCVYRRVVIEKGYFERRTEFGSQIDTKNAVFIKEN